MIEDFLYSDENDEKCPNIKSNEQVTESKESVTTSIIKEKIKVVEDLLYKRIKLPTFDKMNAGDRKTVILPGEVEVDITVLSKNPLIFGK